MKSTRIRCLQLGVDADMVTAVVVQTIYLPDEAVKATIMSIIAQEHAAKEIIVVRLRARGKHCQQV